jgi:hypothetical protein
MPKLLVLLLLVLSCNATGQTVLPGEEGATRAIRGGIQIPSQAPNRSRGTGPFDTLIIKDVMLISGEGAPPRGPVSIVIRNDVIESILASAPDIANAEVIDASSMYALPGLIDSHVHIGNTGQGLTGPKRLTNNSRVIL